MEHKHPNVTKRKGEKLSKEIIILDEQISLVRKNHIVDWKKTRDDDFQEAWTENPNSAKTWKIMCTYASGCWGTFRKNSPGLVRAITN